MSAFWVSAAFGALETLLLFAVGILFSKRKGLFGCLILILKGIGYYYGVKKMLAVYYEYMIYCVFGVFAGFAVTATVISVVLITVPLILKKFRKNI